MMDSRDTRFLLPVLVFLLLLLGACARYLPVRWQEAPGRADSVAQAGVRLAESLEAGLRAYRRDRRRGAGALSGERPLRVVIAAIPEARTGLRTEFSARIERALRRALGASPLFEVVGGEEGVAWQEAVISRAGIGRALMAASRESASTGGETGNKKKEGEGENENEDEAEEESFPGDIEPGLEWWGELGEITGEIARRRRNGEEEGAAEKSLSAMLDSDHPVEGLWPSARKGRYGEGSAVYAASILEAEAAVFGAYALGPRRVRLWAGVVRNAPPRVIHYARGIADIFGTPERPENSRVYYGLARDSLARESIPAGWLSVWLPPRPRARPQAPRRWSAPGFEVAFETIGRKGERNRVTGGALVGADAQLVGRVAVGALRYLYAFSIDQRGRTDEVLASLAGGAPLRIRPGQEANFAARLLPAGRAYRIYFVSSDAPFPAGPVLDAARRRLGIGKNGADSLAGNYREAARGAPARAWYLSPGQEGLLIGKGWDQQVFWFYRSAAARP